MTYFRMVYPTLSLALRRFTVLFGMGRGGSTSLLSSDIGLRLKTRNWRLEKTSLTIQISSRSSEEVKW